MPRENWKACVQEDAAGFAGVDDIDNDTVQAKASDQVQWRWMISCQRYVQCRPLQQQERDLFV